MEIKWNAQVHTMNLQQIQDMKPALNFPVPSTIEDDAPSGECTQT